MNRREKAIAKAIAKENPLNLPSVEGNYFFNEGNVYLGQSFARYSREFRAIKKEVNLLSKNMWNNINDLEKQSRIQQNGRA